MTESVTELLQGVAALLAALGLHGPGTALALLGASALIGALGAAVISVARATLAASPLHLAVGLRARRHAILLGHLPDASHPDAAGHTRSRAPGLPIPAA